MSESKVVPPAAIAAGSGADAVSVAKKADLDKMKDEFATLMKRRAGLDEQLRENDLRAGSARDTTPRSVGGGAPTAIRYRDAVMAVEKALDKHPQVVALQEEHEAVQKEKVAFSMKQGEILNAWRKATKDKDSEFRKLVEKKKADAEAAKQVIYKKAGISGDPRKVKEDAAKLTEADERELEKIANQLIEDLVPLVSAHTPEKVEAQLKEEREKDGSSKQFDELMDQIKALDAKQGEIRGRQGARRASLRQSDPAIVALQSAAYQASEAHLVAAESAPETVAANKFIENATREKAQLDKRARVLRNAILAQEPEYKNVMDKQAYTAGLKVEESFWKIEG